MAITGATGVVNDYLNANDVVSVTVTMNGAVNVTGTPQFALTIGSSTVQANYLSGSGTAALVFTYTILAGQTDTNGVSIPTNALTLNGGTIRDAAGNDATLAHSSVGSDNNYMVDTTGPALTFTTADNSANSLSGTATDANGVTSVVAVRNSDSLLLGQDTSFGGGGSWSIPNSTFVTGNVITATATDTAGNTTSVARTAVDPIILDLDGDGVSFSSIADGAAFDMTADGIVDQVAWNTSNDGILAMDLDGDGVVDDSGELLSQNFNGGGFATGGEALASLDDNGDGIIDADDEAFASLSIWQDTNADSVTDAGELKSLADHGIASITAPASPTNGTIGGQAVIGEGTFTRTDGSIGDYVEVALDTQVGLEPDAAAPAGHAFVIDDLAMVDLIPDYSFDDGDRLDISSLLEGNFGSEASGGNVGDFVRLQQSGDDLVVQVDTDGAADAQTWADAATLPGMGAVGAAINVIFSNDTETTVTV